MMKLSTLELEKPIIIEEGRFVPLKELLMKQKKYPRLISESRKKIASLAVLPKELVIRRYKNEPKNKVLHILGKRSLTIAEVIQEIQEESIMGRELIEREKMWIDFLLSEIEKGNVE